MTETWERALTLMRESLALLDEGGAPHDIGAHLDLAICRLVEALGAGGESGTDETRQVKAADPIRTDVGRPQLR